MRRLAPSTLAALLLAALGVAPTPVRAQDGGPAATRQTISVNPLYLPLGMFVVEYERSIASGATFGLSGGYYDPIGQDEGDEDIYASAEVKFRYYPGERAPRGFAIGVTGGVAHVSSEQGCCTCEGEPFDDDERVTRPTLGVVLDYNWLLGRRRRFLVGTGIGAKRLLGSGGRSDFFDDLDVIPTVRLQVGAAF